MRTIFEFESYREVINDYLIDESAKNKGWGLKSALARALGIHGAHLSQILNEKKHLTLEQVEKLARFIGLSDEEREFLIILHQENRAGTQELIKFFRNKRIKLRDDFRDIGKRYGAKKTLSDDDQVHYYSHWLFAAVHMAIAIPKLNTARAIADYFRVAESKVHDVLQFLLRAGLVKKSSSGYELTELWVRLARDSPLMVQHHYNVRFKALESVNRGIEADLHYSGYFTFSERDYSAIREIWYESIRKMQIAIEPSPSEALIAVSLDLFRI